MAQRLVPALQQIITASGEVATGYKLKTYATLTTTPLATYSNEALSIANANPATGATTGNQIVDANGYFGDIWVDDPINYKVVLTDENNVVIETHDPVNGSISNSLITFDPMPTAYWGTTAGTSSAYTLAADPNISTIGYSNTQTFLLAFHTANAASPTIAINGLAALNLKKYTNRGTKIALLAGDVQAQRYLATNDGTDIVILNPTTLPLNTGINATITIASDTATITNGGSNYLLIGEGSTTDNLSTINGGSEGQIIYLTSFGSPVITIKNGTGNLYTANAIDYPIQSSELDWIALRFDGTNWREISRSNVNGALLKTTTVATASEATITDAYIFTQYVKIEFDFEITVATDAVYLGVQFSVNGGSAYISANYIGSVTQTSSLDGVAGQIGPTDRIAISSNAAGWGISNASTNTYRGTIILKNPSNSTRYKSLEIDRVSYDNASGNFVNLNGSGRYEGATTAVNAIRFFPSSGNISGTIRTRGYT